MQTTEAINMLLRLAPAKVRAAGTGFVKAAEGDIRMLAVLEAKMLDLGLVVKRVQEKKETPSAGLAHWLCLCRTAGNDRAKPEVLVNLDSLVAAILADQAGVDKALGPAVSMIARLL